MLDQTTSKIANQKGKYNGIKTKTLNTDLLKSIPLTILYSSLISFITKKDLIRDAADSIS